MTVKDFKKLQKKKINKFRNRYVVIDGIKFDSKKESQYYLFLKRLKQRGVVRHFERQVGIDLIPAYIKNGKKVRGMKYYIDFIVYYENGGVEYIDVKPSYKFQDSVYKIKKKLLHYLYPDITIKEVYDISL